MIARAAYARLVYEDAAMTGLGFTQARVFASNSVDTPERDQPFIVINVDLAEKAFAGTGAEIVSFWVHWARSKGRDYATIDNALLRIKELMLAAQQFAGDDGWVLAAGSWIDTSRDLTDEAYDTLVKYITFRAAVRSVVTT
mgnify:CR=1 FL=1